MAVVAALWGIWHIVSGFAAAHSPIQAHRSGHNKPVTDPAPPILVTGAGGHVGSAFLATLDEATRSRTIATDLRLPTDARRSVSWRELDVTDAAEVDRVIAKAAGGKRSCTSPPS